MNDNYIFLFILILLLIAIYHFYFCPYNHLKCAYHRRIDAVQAITTLANAASSPTPAPTLAVESVAKTALSEAKTSAGVAAIQVLSEQAISSTAAPSQAVAQTATTALKSL